MSLQNNFPDPARPLKNAALLGDYFAQIQVLDYEAVSGGVFDSTAMMELWDDAGTLTIKGPDPIGTKVFQGSAQIRAFYEDRAAGAISQELSDMVWNLESVKADGAGGAAVKGMRYLVDSQGQGFEVGFQHNFEINPAGKISALTLNVSDPGSTPLVPKGALTVVDMGKLTSVAWMVA